MIGEKLYRVYHDNSPSPFVPGHGFIAADTSNPFDPASLHVVKIAVERHTDYYNQIATPFISVVDSYPLALDKANALSTNTDLHVKIAIIEYARLRDNYGIHVFRLTELIKMTHANVTPEHRQTPAHCVCVHHIPSGAITEICSLGEFIRHPVYSRELLVSVPVRHLTQW
jgi:hypothetical protein